jgi:hypothetical protein
VVVNGTLVTMGTLLAIAEVGISNRLWSLLSKKIMTTQHMIVRKIMIEKFAVVIYF